MSGILLAAVFDGIAIGTLLAPRIQVLFGHDSLDDPFWESLPVRAVEFVSLALALGSLALTYSGFLKHRLIQYDEA